jgi:hypothetical protein
MPEIPSHPPKAFFEGVSAPVRYLLAACILLFALLFPLSPSSWSMKKAVAVVIVESISNPLLLILASPRKFAVLGRVLAGWMFALCLVYVAYQWLAPSWFLEGGLGSPNRFNSLRALLLLGLPSAWYAWKGKLI